MKTTLLRAALLVAFLAGGLGYSAAQVKVWEGNLKLPTYQELSPDPNPPFDTYQTNQFSYPYTLRKNLTAQKEDHAWRAVFLENEYLKCSILPDIGGHLYTCIDKINGRPIFYANRSIKKAQIGYRGAWAAFGIEFNFPVSHNWVSVSPVDFAYATQPDGSASVTVGNVDRVYGMQWRVELILRPGSTLLEQKVTLYNRSDVRHRYYWWNNAAVEVWDDSRIEYPMRFAASHGFTEVRRWPVGPEGNDLSVIKNQLNGPVSHFAHGTREPFMAIWNPHAQSGTVHYAEYSELPAKKIWSWGVDADGLGWRKILSDNDSAYVEVQAGLFRNQETYAFLDPGQTIHFSEYWMPVRDTGGISRANKIGVVSLQHQGSKEFAALNVNERLPGARIQLLQKDKILWSETADLAPETTWRHSLSVENPDPKLTFELRDRDGVLLLQHTDGSYDWDPESNIVVGPQPVDHLPPVQSRTADDWLKLGTDQELDGKVVLALDTYKSALAKFPQSFALQVASGRLAASLQRFVEATELLRTAQARETSNAEIAYYLGIAEDGLAHAQEAQTAFEIAYRQPAFRARAAARLAQLAAQRADLHSAQQFLQQAVEASPQDTLIREQLEAITRSIGETARADELARIGFTLDPTSDFLKEDTGTPDLPHLAADPYRVLRLAADYMNLGLYEKALAVLTRTYPPVPADESEPGSVLPQNHPLIRYYAAYCKSKLYQAVESDWKAASALPSAFVFPSSATDLAVLESAVKSNADDASAHYLLGTLLFSKGMYEPALTQWTDAKHANPKMPVLDADMGKAWLYIKGDATRAVDSFREGIRNDPANPENYAGLDTAMSLRGAPAKERAEELGHYPEAGASDSSMPANLVYQLALARAEAGQYEQALALFHNRFFPSEEGGVSASQVEFEITLMQAKANAEQGRCADAQALLAGYHRGLVANEASSRPDLTMGIIEKKCGKQDQAETYLRKAADGHTGADIAWANRAQQLLGTYDPIQSRHKLQESLAEVERMNEANQSNGLWWYTLGTLQSALDQKGPARESFTKAILLPDRMMSHHLARLAMADLGPATQSGAANQ